MRVAHSKNSRMVQQTISGALGCYQENNYAKMGRRVDQADFMDHFVERNCGLECSQN